MKDRGIDVEVAIVSGLDPCGGWRHGFLDRGGALPSVKRERGDIDKRRDLWIVAGFGDDRTAVAMAHQNDWAGLPIDHGLCELDVFRKGRLRVLYNRHRVPVLCEDGGDGLPAGAIGECAM